MTQAMTNAALWIAQITALYAWKILGMDGAGNLLTAWIVVMFILVSLFVVMADTKKPYVKPKGLPWWVNRPLNVLFFCALAWFGHGWLAAMYGISCFVSTAVHGAWRLEHEKRVKAAAA
jgi:hypothetical protein